MNADVDLVDDKAEYQPAARTIPPVLTADSFSGV